MAPATGESHWYVGNRVSKPLFERLLALFAQEAGASERTIILLLDGAGWHTQPGLRVPDGLRLVYLPPYSPELQPAEPLWQWIDEPIVNRHYDRLDQIQHRIEQRCRQVVSALVVETGTFDGVTEVATGLAGQGGVARLQPDRRTR